MSKSSTTWRDVTTDQLALVFERIHDARELYAVEHFPADVQHLVRQDFRRHFSGGGHCNDIWRNDGTSPEAVNAILGLELAYRIADERGVDYQHAMGRQTTLERIKEAALGVGAEQ